MPVHPQRIARVHFTLLPGSVEKGQNKEDFLSCLQADEAV